MVPLDGVEPSTSLYQRDILPLQTMGANKIGRLTILLGGLIRLSRIVKFNTGFNHTVVSPQYTTLWLDWQGLKTIVYPITGRGNWI